MAAVLSASIASVFVTGYLPFIKTQTLRSDLQDKRAFRHGTRPSDIPTNLKWDLKA